MKTRTYQTVITYYQKILLFLTFICSSSLLANQTTDSFNWPCEYCPLPMATNANMAISYGYLFDDIYHFAHNTGIEPSNNWSLSSDVSFQNQQAQYATFSLTNAGLDAMALLAQAGTYGKYQFSLNYQQIPVRTYAQLATPFAIQGNQLTLADNWLAIDQRSSPVTTRELRSFSTGVDWQNMKLSWRYFASRQLDYSLNYQRIEKTGSMQFTAAQLLNVSYLPLTLNQQTEQLNAQVSYQADKVNLSLGYFLSHFDNQYDAYEYQQPFSSYVAGGDITQVSASPDNKAYKIHINANYQLFPSSSLKVYAALGAMRQHTMLLPYSSNTLLNNALPRVDFDAKVATKDIAIRLYHRSSNSLSLRAKYQYHERDNQSTQYVFSPVINDTYVGADEQNVPYDHQKEQYSVAGYWRFLPQQQLSIEFSKNSKSEQAHHAHHSNDQGVLANLLLQNDSGLQFTLRASHFARDAQSNQLAQWFTTENPLLQRYNNADRDENQLNIFISKALTAQLAATFTSGLIKQHYRQSSLGLSSNDRYNYGLDLTWRAAEHTNVSFYYQSEHIKALANNMDMTSLWSMASQDQIQNFGVSVDVANLLDNKLEISMQANNSNGTSDMRVSQTNQQQLPKINSIWRQFKLNFNYKFSPTISSQLLYQHEQLNQHDYALELLGVNTMHNVLSDGAIPHNYNANYLAITFSYQF